MKITGSNNYVKFDLENGYVIKAEGEMLMGRKKKTTRKEEKTKNEHISRIIWNLF